MKISSINFGIILVSAFGIGFAVKACATSEIVETFGAKGEWATLQAIEAETRNTPIKDPVLQKQDDRELIGIAGPAGKNIWILLKPGTPPYYKQMPTGPYDFPAALVEKLERENRLSPTVAAVLRTHTR